MPIDYRDFEQELTERVYQVGLKSKSKELINLSRANGIAKQCSSAIKELENKTPGVLAKYLGKTSKQLVKSVFRLIRTALLDDFNRGKDWYVREEIEKGTAGLDELWEDTKYKLTAELKKEIPPYEGFIGTYDKQRDDVVENIVSNFLIEAIGSGVSPSDITEKDLTQMVDLVKDSAKKYLKNILVPLMRPLDWLHQQLLTK